MSEFIVSTARQTNRTSPARWIFSHARHNPLPIVTMLVGAFGNAALAALVPILIGIAFEAVLSTPADSRTLGLAALGILASQSLRAGLQWGRNFSSEVIGRRLERDTREELYVSLLGKSMTFHDYQPVGDVMARATNDVTEINLMIAPGLNLVIGSANFMIMPLILAPRYDAALVFAPAFFIVTYAIALARYLRVLRPISDRVRASFGRMNSRLAEAIDGIEVVKATAQEKQEIQRFAANAGAYRDATVDLGKQEARFLPLLLLGITNAIGFTHALVLFFDGALGVGDVVAYMGLLSLFGFPTFISLTAYSQVSRGMAGTRRILELINTENDLDENRGGFRENILGSITFEHVSFGYVSGTKVLRDVSFQVEPGETVAVVGQTGAGKSTVAKLVNRTYDTDMGRVLVDGVDVRDWDLAALRRQISIIEQDIFLFSRTLAENIRFGKPEASQEEVEEAARAAQAHDFIMSFADGYDTMVGARGVTLSGGQRQRLALARAFLAQPRILVLDDSTSAVDSATEDKIQQAISRAAANQTTILITHRLSQIRWADKVVLLRKGAVEAVGSHDDLMRMHAAYRRIFEQYSAA
jgi:ATP-binding cassette subfamily B protein